MRDLWTALCLVAVLEGMLLFITPRGWRRAVEQLQELPDHQIRAIGGIVLAVGLVILYFVRSNA